MFSFLRKTCLWIILLPVAVSFTGAALNQLVLYVNHDAFPVTLNPTKLAKAKPDEDGMIDDIHEVATDETHLNWLGDIFDFHDDVESVGDLLIEAGEWMGGFSLPIYVFAVSTQALRRLQP